VSDISEEKHELAEEQDQKRSPWAWRSIRDGGLGFLISICIFAATAFIVSALY
jgi:hypothetical protein